MKKLLLILLYFPFIYSCELNNNDCNEKVKKLEETINMLEHEILSFKKEIEDKESRSTPITQLGYVKFTSMETTIIPESNFVLRGDSFKSKILLTAFDKTITPEIYICDYDSMPDGTYHIKGDYLELPIVNGQGNYTVRSHTAGLKTYKGLIKIQQQDENGIWKERYYPFQSSYMVLEREKN